ncbi:MAG: hypothetical protein AB1938_23370 [Myxococcota bacterium]
MAESDLQKRLEQLGKRLVEDIERWEQSTRQKRRETLTNLTEHIGDQIAKAVERERERHERLRESKRERRAREKEARRAQQLERASGVVGVAQILAAIAFVVFAVLRPELWWLLFIALGLGVGGAKQLSLAAERRRLERGEPAARSEPAKHPPAEDAQAHEVDVLCDQLLVDLKGAPAAVRQFVQTPEKTIAALRRTARALDARRRQLLAERPAERLEALGPQAEALESRRDQASDPVTKQRLSEALASLEGQRDALTQLKVAAERVDGEYTSLLVSLQELRTRVAVAKTAGSEVQLAGLKDSVQRLNGELEAISEALTAVAGGQLAPVAPISAGEPVAPATDHRERA